jgi:hypothetical protein
MGACGDTAIQLTLRLALAAMFAAAALHKARDLRAFAATLRNFRCTPAVAVPAAAVALVAVELAVAVALLAAPRPGAGAALALLALYSGAIGLNLARGRRDIDCGCLGPGHRQPLSEWLLLRNGAAAAAAGLLLLPEQARPLGIVDAVTVVAASFALALLWTAGNQLLEHAPRLRGARP